MTDDPDKRSPSSTNDAKRDALEGAERAGDLLGQWGMRVGRGLAAVAVRVREEVEDMWADAQSIRRGERD